MIDDPLYNPCLLPERRFREPIGNEHLDRGAGGHFTHAAVDELRTAKAAGWKPSWTKE